MSRARFIALIVAALLAISGALYLGAQRNLPRDQRDTALLPGFANQLNTVSALSVRKGSKDPTATLRKSGEHWTVAERADFPADNSKLRKLLLALAEAKIVEEKTSDPANFSVIGVEDPSLPNAAGAEVSVVAADGRRALIVGKPVGAGNFARRSGENQSYSVEPGISFEAEPRHWIDSRLIDIAADKVQRLELKPASGPAYSVHRIAPGKDDFALDGLPAGRKAAEARSLAPSSSAFSGLSAEDVAAAGDIDFSQASTATLTLADGEVIRLIGTPGTEKHWIKIEAGKDAALTAKAAGRAFEIQGYRYDMIFRPLERLLESKPAPPAP